MTRGQNQQAARRKRPRRRGSRPWGGEEEQAAPPSKPLDWRKGVGQAIEASFSAGAVALRKKLGLNTETNFIDSANNAALGTTIALIDSCGSIPIGATAGTGQRIGREVRVVRYQVRAYVYVPATCTGIGLARVLAVFNRQQDGKAFVAADVLATTSSIVSMVAGDLAEHGGTIVYDKVFKLLSTNGGVPQNEAVMQPLMFEFEVPDWHCAWPTADTTGVQTANLGGAIQLWAFQTGIATTSPQIVFTTRLEYVDN